MKKNILNSVLAAGVLVMMGSCASKRQVVVQEPVKTEPVQISSNAATISAIEASQLNFETFAVRAKADLAIGSNKNDVTMHIRIKKDQAIWVSVTALAGLEVGRALITPDSIRIINRIQSEYIKKPFSYIHQFTNPQVNFKTVESLFTGNTIPNLLNEQATVVASPKLNVTGTSGLLSFIMVFLDTKKVSELQLKDEKTGRTVNVLYSDFTVLNGKEVPQHVNITSQAADKQFGLDMKYNKVDINAPVDMPFSVSKRFTVKD